MRSRLTSALAVLGAVALLLVAGNTAAYAAGGHGFSLGHSNKSKKQTTLTRTRPGPALALDTTGGTPPFAVNSSGKVTSLNADLVDGVDSSAMVNRTLVFTRSLSTATSGAFDMNLPVPPGTYTASYAAYLYGGSGNSACYFLVGGRYQLVDQISAPAGWYPGMSAAGTITVAPGEAVVLHCVAGAGTYTTLASDPIQASFSATNVTGGGNARIASSDRTAEPVH